MPKSLRTYQRTIQRLTSLVSDMHWVQPTYNGSPSCAYCGAQQHQGCVEGCPVAKVTGDAGGREDSE